MATAHDPPDEATLAFDGRWWVSFPEGATPSLRAAIEDGSGFAEYVAVDGDDTLVVRVTEVPTGYEWIAAEAVSAAAERIGGEVLESDDVVVAGRPAVDIKLARDDSVTAGEIAEMLIVDAGDRIYTVAFEDGDATSSDDATAFIDSFGLPEPGTLSDVRVPPHDHADRLEGHERDLKVRPCGSPSS